MSAAIPETRRGYFPHWKLKTTGVILPEERLPWTQTIVAGLQHGIAMRMADAGRGPILLWRVDRQDIGDPASWQQKQSLICGDIPDKQD